MQPPKRVRTSAAKPSSKKVKSKEIIDDNAGSDSDRQKGEANDKPGEEKKKKRDRSKESSKAKKEKADKNGKEEKKPTRKRKESKKVCSKIFSGFQNFPCFGLF